MWGSARRWTYHQVWFILGQQDPADQSLNLIKQVFLRDVRAFIFTTQYAGSHPSIVIVRLSGTTAISGIKSWILTHECGPCKRLFSDVIAITSYLNKMNEVWSGISHLKVESVKWNWEIKTRMQNYKYVIQKTHIHLYHFRNESKMFWGISDIYVWYFQRNNYLFTEGFFFFIPCLTLRASALNIWG